MTALAPAVILVGTQLAENIGMTARAMLNCGLTDLRLVRPRPQWPNERAAAAAAGADAVLDGARIFGTTAEAIADLHYVYATTGRAREIVKPVVTGRAAAAEIRERGARAERSGLMFGPERTGLENDDVTLAQSILRVPLNPEYGSLNIAQAVLLAAYEWHLAADATPARVAPDSMAESATSGEVNEFLDRLEAELVECGFLRNPEMRPTMVRNIRAIFMRAGLMTHEVRTLHGIVTGLTERPHAASAAPRGSAGSRQPVRRPRKVP
ncbi:MAG: RNA methyltransferase [Gemmatimonadota bacterium]